ncbi:MAG TPA: hypothetical protein VME24_02930 [Alphaproteobacteria bacterium]|nr:hypothetical protein [Alphaproteobacteria bacterium]
MRQIITFSQITHSQPIHSPITPNRTASQLSSVTTKHFSLIAYILAHSGS